VAVYTCYDMVRDCGLNKRDGWRHFCSRYLAAAGEMMDRYAPGRWPTGELRPNAYRDLLLSLQHPENTFFRSLKPSQERVLLVSLRDYLLERYANENPDAATVLMDAIVEGLKELTVVEKQLVWLDTMNYSGQDVGAMMFVDPATVARAREKGGELLRGHLDAWGMGVVASNAVTLRHDVRKLRTEECLDPRIFCDAIDGRLTWETKTGMEYHLAGCWYCIDHFCRIRDADWTLSRTTGTLMAEEDVSGLLKTLGFERPKKTLWRKVMGA
jgi:hypothetical protein